jgi:hypothetical protein
MSKELRILVWSFLIGIVSMVGHNLFYALGEVFSGFGIFFEVLSVILFFLTLISAFLFFIVVIYVGVKYLIFGKPRDGWKIGWIGLVLMVFFLIVGMNSLWFYVFAGVLILFFIGRIVR